MQTNNRNTVLIILAVVMFSLALPIASASANSMCDITKPDGNGDTPEAGSLAYAILLHSLDSNQQQCAEKITINSHIQISRTLEIDRDQMENHHKLTISGANENERFQIQSSINSTDPVFLIKKAEQVTISNLDIVNDSSSNPPDADGKLAYASAPFIVCDNAESLTLENITIKNNPSAPLVFKDCGNVTITNLEIKSQDDSYYPAVDVTVPYISIVGGSATINSITINSLSADSALDRNAIEITDVISPLHLDKLTVNAGVRNPAATVLYMENIEDLQSFNVDIQGVVAKHGVELKDVSAPNAAAVLTIQNITSVSSDSTGDVSPGDALVISGDSNFLNFNLTGDIAYFGGAGVSIEREAGMMPKNIGITGGNIHENGSYGISIPEATDEQEEGTITLENILTKENGNCGVYLRSPQVVKGVDYVNNYHGCSLGFSSASGLKADADAVMLVATSPQDVALDVNKNLVTDGTTKVELHYFYAVKGSQSMTPTIIPGSYPVVTPPTRGTLSDVVVRPNQSQSSQTDPVAATSEQETSQIGRAMSFPNTSEVKSIDYTYMVLLKNDDGLVSGVWYGDTDSTAGSECIAGYEFLPEDGGGCGCVAGPSSTTPVRVYRSDVADTDQDGLPDVQEHGGSCRTDEYNTVSNSEKTYPYRADTDEDGLSDYEERVLYSDDDGTVDTRPDPLNPDSDGDQISDGDEDTHNEAGEPIPDGRYNQGFETSALRIDTDGDGSTDNDEIGNDGTYDPLFDTNPMKKDSDGDGLMDGSEEERHPLCNDLTSSCTYSDCVNVDDISGEVGADVSGSDAAINYTDDDDGDGLPNRLEDTDGDCTFDAGETNPLSQDTDADGCTDGQEDIDHNGSPLDEATGLVAVETDPRSPDSDGDLIKDSVESPTCIYTGDLDDTNPLVPDTDDDGINDGDEDRNQNGALDAGETDPALVDTDNDDLIDAAYPVEVTVDENGNVVPVLEGADLSPFVYDPSNTTLSYYCGLSDFDTYDTDGDNVYDSVEAPNCKAEPTKSDTANPLLADTDDDGLPDDLEFCYGSSPYAIDSEGDGLSDYDEYTNKGRIAIETLRSTCKDGPLQSLGATNGLDVTTGCSLNSNLLATSTTVSPITGLAVVVLGLMLLRKRQTA